jgi:hypothetical protein
MKFKLLVLAVVTSASGLMAQTHFQVRPITIHGAVPAVHNVNPLVVPRTVTPVNPVVRNVSPVRPLQVQPQTVIQPQRLSPAQSRALDNAVFANNYNLYRESHESHVVPNQTVETQANHIARLQGIIQSGTQLVSVMGLPAPAFPVRRYGKRKLRCGNLAITTARSTDYSAPLHRKP